MSAFNPQWVTGRRIVAVEMNPFETGDRLNKTSHNPVFVLDNGAKIGFVVDETEVGSYGLTLVYTKKDATK